MRCGLDFDGATAAARPRWDKHALVQLVRKGKQQSEFHGALEERLNSKLFGDALEDAKNTTLLYGVISGAVFRTAWEFFAEGGECERAQAG